jgi:uncharacterized glyoxalase superfamily protein PhnB
MHVCATVPSLLARTARRHTSYKNFDDPSQAGAAIPAVPAWYRSIETDKEIAMAAKVKPIPQGFHTITPYLVVDGAEKIIRFMKEAFGAELVLEPTTRPDGKIMHAQVKIGDSILMISDLSERAQATSDMIYLYVANVDAVYQKALKAGATSLMEPMDQFYGDRSGGVKDPAGNRWFIGTHVEDVSPAELKKRAAEFFKQQHKAA